MQQAVCELCRHILVWSYISFHGKTTQVVLQRSEDKFGQNSVDEIVTEEGEEELDGEGKVLETSAAVRGSKDGACESNAESVEGERRKADGSTSVNESGDFAEEQPGLAEASFKDSHHHEHLDSAELLSDRMSDHKLHAENVSSSTATSTVVKTTASTSHAAVRQSRLFLRSISLALGLPLSVAHSREHLALVHKCENGRGTHLTWRVSSRLSPRNSV